MRDESTRELARGISVVVPVYNSEATLESLVARVEDVLRQTGHDFELLLINDGSRDGSWRVVSRLAESRPTWVRGINLMRNYGQHNALLCGIRAARFDVTVTLDDDLQHPPEHIPRLLEKLNSGFDVVYGSPEKLSHTWLRNVLSRSTKAILGRAMGLSTIVNIGAFRAFHTAVREGFRDFASPNPMIDILLSWGTSRFTSISVPHEPRRVGTSNYTVGKLFNQAMLLIIGFTTAPLRAASLIGFVFTLFGIVVFVWVLERYLLYGSVPGFPFLASLISLFSGAQLFALGIMGEYLARMFNRSMDRPAYVVRQMTDSKAPPEQGRRPEEIRVGVRQQEMVCADVTLRPITADDAPAMLRWMCDPLVAANVGVRASPSIEKTRQWIERAAADASMLPRAILLKGAHVGNVVLDRIDEYLRSARLSIYLGEPAARGRGVASRAINLVLTEAFVRLRLNKVWLTVHCRNAAAIRTYVRLGFAIEGVLREEFVLNGERIDLLYMSVLADEFAGRSV